MVLQRGYGLEELKLMGFSFSFIKLNLRLEIFCILYTEKLPEII